MITQEHNAEIEQSDGNKTSDRIVITKNTLRIVDLGITVILPDSSDAFGMEEIWNLKEEIEDLRTELKYCSKELNFLIDKYEPEEE